MDRRAFLANAGLAAAWAAIQITVGGCGNGYSSKKSPTGPSDPCAETAIVSVASGHTHSACVTEEQPEAGNAVTLTLTGGGHTHTASLSSDQVVAIAAGTQVVVNSSVTGSHFHVVTFNA
ncbi:MAG: hypothetical protein QUU85_07505 [Candidatus Eisenbacteria bacterium]|nr:hypothetical protein [Candidatus Eisenbacteria bacterium]